MGSIYTVKVYTKVGEGFQWLGVHNGQKLLPALWALWRNRREGGAVVLEVRLPKKDAE